MDNGKPKIGRPLGPRKAGEWKKLGTFVRVEHLDSLKIEAVKRRRPVYMMLDEMISAGLAALPVVPGLAAVPGEGE